MAHSIEIEHFKRNLSLVRRSHLKVPNGWVKYGEIYRDECSRLVYVCILCTKHNEMSFACTDVAELLDHLDKCHFVEQNGTAAANEKDTNTNAASLGDDNSTQMSTTITVDLLSDDEGETVHENSVEEKAKDCIMKDVMVESSPKNLPENEENVVLNFKDTDMFDESLDDDTRDSYLSADSAETQIFEEESLGTLIEMTPDGNVAVESDKPTGFCDDEIVELLSDDEDEVDGMIDKNNVQDKDKEVVVYELHFQGNSNGSVNVNVTTATSKTNPMKTKVTAEKSDQNAMETNDYDDEGILSSDQSAFKCNYCDKSFYAVWQLDRHHRMHIANSNKISTRAKRPYQCTKCRVRTSSEKTLLVHFQKFHSEGPDAEAAVCTICYKSVLKTKMQHHISGHSNVGQYKCHLCHRSYKQKQTLTMHIKQHHPQPAEMPPPSTVRESTTMPAATATLTNITAKAVPNATPTAMSAVETQQPINYASATTTHATTTNTISTPQLPQLSEEENAYMYALYMRLSSQQYNQSNQRLAHNAWQNTMQSTISNGFAQMMSQSSPPLTPPLYPPPAPIMPPPPFYNGSNYF